jgi:hypothetical protein
MARNQGIYITFIYLQKHMILYQVKLWEILQETKINYILIKALKNLYEDTKSRIKQNNSLSMDFSLSKRLSQRCCISPKTYVFKILHLCIKRKCYGMRIELKEQCLYTIQFADD